MQAKLLADQEEREVQRLVLAAIEAQFKKVHAKLQVCWARRGRRQSCPGWGWAPPAASMAPGGGPFCLPAAALTHTHTYNTLNGFPPRASRQYLEELDSVMASERLSLEAMRGKFVDEYQQAVADNAAAGLPPPGRPASAGAAAAPTTGPATTAAEPAATSAREQL